MFLAHVNHEEGSGQAIEVGDRTEVLLKLGTLAADLEDFTLGEVGESAICGELVDVSHLLHRLADSGEVGEHTTGPALSNVRHIDSCGLLGNSQFGLFLSSYKKDATTRLCDFFERFSSFVNFSNSLVEVNDVDTVALHEDVRSHSGIPLAFEVAEVAAGLEEGFKICS